MRKIKWGVIACGGIADRRTIPGMMLASNCELVGVMDTNLEVAEKVAEKYGAKFATADYRDILANEEIEAVYIPLPNNLHCEWAIKALNKKKHVLCEKPMAVNTREAEEMFTCSKKNNVLLMEAMWARLVPGTIKMLELVQNGVLGDILGVEGKFCYTMDEDEMDHHVFKIENGGGSLLDVGVYGLNFATWYLGKDVTDINAQADFYNGTDSHTCALIKYKSGAIADISSATLLRKPNEGFVYGTKGYAYLQRFYAPQEIKLNLNNGDTQVIKTPYAGNGFEEQITHFSNCVLNGLTESPVITHEQTLYITQQMDKIREIIGVKYPQDI
jgi:predicted dehydrogenase